MFMEFVAMLHTVASFAISLASTIFLSAPGYAEPGPSMTDPAAIAAGQIRFNRNCGYCHGNACAGGKGAPLQGRDDLTADYLFKTITEGKKQGSLQMLAWRDAFTDKEVQELSAYILSLRFVNLKR
jgi:mono/diheme cytochrome c family protein